MGYKKWLKRSQQRFFFSERLRSGALLLTLSEKFSYYITFTILYNVPGNFLVDIFLKFRTGKVTLLSQNELVLPRGQNDSTLLSVFLVLKKATGFPGNATTCYILFEYFQQVGKTTNIYLIFPTFRPKNFSQKRRFYIVQNYHDFRSEIVIIL